MIIAPLAGYQSCSSVLNRLQLAKSRFGRSVIDAVTVVDSTCDECMSQCVNKMWMMTMIMMMMMSKHDDDDDVDDNDNNDCDD